MSWFDDLVVGAGEFLKGASYGTIISSWLEKDGNTALNDIEEFVKRSTPEMIDEMDVILLQQATINFDLESRTRLVKFYAFFKICELNRFQKWRGFPSTS